MADVSSAIYQDPRYLSVFPTGPRSSTGAGKKDAQRTAALVQAGVLPAGYAVYDNGFVFGPDGSFVPTTDTGGQSGQLFAGPKKFATDVKDVIQNTNKVVVPAALALGTYGLASALTGPVAAAGAVPEIANAGKVGAGVGGGGVAGSGLSWGQLLPAIIGTAGGVTQAVIGHNAAQDAAAQEQAALEKAIAEQRRQFDVTQGNIAPYLALGKGASGKLGYLLGTS